MIFIDLDNTLIDRLAGFTRWAQAFLDSIGRLEPDERAWLESVDRDGLAPRDEFFRLVRARYSFDDSIQDLTDTYVAAIAQLIPPLTPETLDALRLARQRGFKTCIVTNGSRRTQEPKIGRELADAVDGWVISGELGTAKPDPDLLREAAAVCGERLTTDSWMIGDRPETDILIACRADIRSAWVTRGSRWDGHLDYRPTIEADSFAQAVERILAFPQNPGSN
jgi:FMN phosphatase YigB (HAD superfamily)